MRRLVLLPATVLLVLSGCTSSTDSDGADGPTPGEGTSGGPGASGTAGAPAGPDCADIWKDGETLPANYGTCVDGGVAAEQDTTPCLDGRTLVAYKDAYFAITGEKISQPDIAPMQDTQEFAAAYSACTGE